MLAGWDLRRSIDNQIVRFSGGPNDGAGVQTMVVSVQA